MPRVTHPASHDPSPTDTIAPHAAAVEFIGDTQPAPVSHALSEQPVLDRRNLLRTGLAATAAAAAAAITGVSPAGVAQAQPPLSPAMRCAQHDLAGAGIAAGVEAPPAPEIIALNRMAFGPRPGDIDALLALGANTSERLTAYVDQQLNPAGIDDSACDARLAALNLTTLAKPLAQLWLDHTKKENLDWGERMRPAFETRTAAFMRAVYSKRQLTEVLADFWHNHFNVYGFDFWSGTTWVHYDRDVIRANMLGNFRTMVEAVATSPAMLYYLDNISNTSGGPNENFARELFELGTLGAMNYLGSTTRPDSVPKDAEGRPIGYIDSDVYGATRSFTGWRIAPDSGAFFFDNKVHDKYSKTVLGVVMDDFLGVDDGKTVLDLLANHRGTARHVATKLCRRLIGDDPPQSVVDAAAAVFYDQRNAPDQLKQVVRTILLSPEFRTTWGQKVKRPLEYVVSLLRAADADWGPDDSFFWLYERCGQPMFQWQPPNGFPDRKEDWSSTMPMLQRWRLCNWLIDGWRYGGEGPNQDDLRLNLNAQHPASINTAEGIIDFWAARILGRPLPPEERSPIVDFIANGFSRNAPLPAKDITERLRFTVALIFMAPSFQWR